MRQFPYSYDTERSYTIVKSFFEDVCVNAKSPLSDKILRLSRNGHDLDIARLEIRASDYSDAASFSVDYSLVNFLSKWEGLKTGVDTKAVALAAFALQEKSCKISNERLKSHRTSFVEPILHRAQNLVAKVLGPFNMNLFEGTERWGPGATTDMSRRDAYLDKKITDFPIPVTVAALPTLKRVIQKDLHWSYCILGLFPSGKYSLLPHLFTEVLGSDIVTVKKNAKTDRTIAIEPRGNMFLQKSVGSFIRRKLKRYGVDLDDQTLNQRLAALCEELSLATIDLSMASDSICLQLIYELLPLDWVFYLDRLRSRYYRLDTSDTKYVRFEKFSSMGNGFTFELESLLFWALSKASMEVESNQLAVYGDDIILPQGDAPVLISTLAYCGFKVNDQKSFIEGSFFESCGKHYFKGQDVTPIYQKELIEDEMGFVRMSNRVARLLVRNVIDDSLDASPWCKPWRRFVGSRVPGSPQIPLGTEGDEGYLVNHTLAQPTRWKRSYGRQWDIARPKIIRVGTLSDPALLAYSLRQGVVTESPFEGSLPKRIDDKDRRYSMTTRWIEPSWEFALD